MDTKEKEQLEKMEKEMEEQDGVAISDKPKTKQKRKLNLPNNYRVIFHNDDFTPMEFVVWVLQGVFHHPVARAQQIMLDVHQKGKGVAGVYTYEIAETKVYKSMMMAKENNLPLLVTAEEL